LCVIIIINTHQQQSLQFTNTQFSQIFLCTQSVTSKENSANYKYALPFFTYLFIYLLTYLLTYSMEQSPSWEANWSADSQEIPRIYSLHIYF